jgi:hypothetical protein
LLGFVRYYDSHHNWVSSSHPAFQYTDFIFSSKSGVGDFGLAGIKTFLNDHTCGQVCTTLSLEAQVPLVVPDEHIDENGDENGDDNKGDNHSQHSLDDNES